MIKFLKRIHNIQSFSELWDAMTWRGISAFASVPLAWLFVMPLVALGSISLDPMWTYIMSLDTVRKLIPVFSVTALACTVGKQTGEQYPLKKIISDRRALIWFLLFAGWLLISTLTRGFTREDRIGDEYRCEAVWTYISYGLLYFTCGTVVRTERAKKWLYRILVGGSALLAILALLDFYGVIAVESFHNRAQATGDLCAIFSNENHYAYFLLFGVMLSAGLAVYEKKRWLRVLALGSLLLHTFTMVVNTTRGVFLACIGAFVCFLVILLLSGRRFLRRFRTAAAVFGVGIIAGFLAMPELWGLYAEIAKDVKNVAEQNAKALRAGSDRGLLWTMTAQAIGEKPLFGWGTEGIADFLLTKIQNTRPHNEYLQYAAFYGIPALVLYLGGVGSVFVKAFRQRMKLRPMTVIALTAAFGYLCSAFFGNTMYYTAPYFFVTLGFAFQTGLPRRTVALKAGGQK